jgi:hypothetical protein
LKICNTLALPTLVHGCGSWAIKEQVVSGNEIYQENSKIQVARLQSKRQNSKIQVARLQSKRNDFIRT